MNTPSLRKPLGVLLILGVILVWIGIVVQTADWIVTLPWPVQAIFYLIAGTVWIVPLGPILRWMER